MDWTSTYIMYINYIHVYKHHYVYVEVQNLIALAQGILILQYVLILCCMYVSIYVYMYICMSVTLTAMFDVILNKRLTWIFHTTKGLATYLLIWLKTI